ncbi:hypothetical protein BJY01DRAFT_219243 [Aspergillus pseudoustus]|uniref:CENP-V/GFA domain-containing protein n=1 Tax=Aspergillus pseudoustus TaxID=1810923 RepID=A0ABR4JID2_9EURO
MSDHYPAKPSAPFPMEGGCPCGLIRYRMESAPLIVHCCHCTSCQRETGTAFALNAVIESELVTSLPPAAPVVPGSPASSYAQEAGPTVTHWVPDAETARISEAKGNIIEPRIFLAPSASKQGQQIARCPRCAAAVWSFYAGGGPFRKFVRVGTLDEAWKVGPDVHIFTESRRDFVHLADGVPQYSMFYPKAKDVWRKESLERWEKVLPQVMEYRKRGDLIE